MKRRFKTIENTEEEIKNEKNRLSLLIINYFNGDGQFKGRTVDRKKSNTFGSSFNNTYHINNKINPPSLETKSVAINIETQATPISKKKINLKSILKNNSGKLMKTFNRKKRVYKSIANDENIMISHRYTKTFDGIIK